MKYKFFSLMLAICFIVPALVFAGCNNNESTDPYSNYKNISGYYLECEQSNYTDHSVQLVMNIKNDKDYQVKLEPSVFTLRSSENEYSVTGLSVYQQNKWNPTAVRVSVNAGETTTFKLEFSGAGQDSNYYLYYLNTKIATVSQNAFRFV